MAKRVALLAGGCIAACCLAVVWFGFKFGGGEAYPSIATPAIIDEQQVSQPITLPFPPGMVASSPTGRIFYTYHMLHEPERFSEATVFEWRDGGGVPFPSQALQSEFQGAMGITVDAHERLWIIKPGALAGRPTRLIGVSVETGDIVLDHEFEESQAGFAQDMRVSPDGSTVFLADTGLFRFTEPSLIVFDIASKQTRTLLQGHPSVSAQDWIIRKTNGQPYKLAFGLLSFVVGVDGIALSQDGQWLYYATMSHDSLYRIPVAALMDEALSDDQLASHIEFVGHKPMSDGIELLADNSVVITDVENGGLGLLSASGHYQTLTSDPAVDWADSVTVSPDGDLWFTDSRLTALINQFAVPSDEQTMRDSGPYSIYRVSAAALAQTHLADQP